MTQEIISTDMFYWHGKDKYFTQEISSLNNFRINNKFTLKNPKTKGTKVFSLRDTVKDREGDILYWEYISDDGLKVTIFND